MKLHKRVVCNIYFLGFLFSNILSINIYANNIGYIKGNNVNIRSEASKNSEIIAKYNNNRSLKIIDIKDNFFKINLDNNEEGFVSTDFVNIEKIECEINSNNVSIKELPSEDSESIGNLSNHEKVFVLSKKDDWYLIEFNGVNGFINKKFISTELEKFIKDENNFEENYNNKNILDLDNSLTKLSYNNNLYIEEDCINTIKNLDNKQINKDKEEKGKNLISYAKKFLGTPYLWGGTDLKSGVDCSGFVYSVFKKFDINLHRSSYNMIKNGINISKSQLQEGDLVFFNTFGSGISHVGIYISNGNFIHSSSKNKQGISINNLNEGYYQKKYIGATRVL